MTPTHAAGLSLSRRRFICQHVCKVWRMLTTLGSKVPLDETWSMFPQLPQLPSFHTWSRRHASHEQGVSQPAALGPPSPALTQAGRAVWGRHSRLQLCRLLCEGARRKAAGPGAVFTAHVSVPRRSLQASRPRRQVEPMRLLGLSLKPLLRAQRRNFYEAENRTKIQQAFWVHARKK